MNEYRDSGKYPPAVTVEGRTCAQLLGADLPLTDTQVSELLAAPVLVENLRAGLARHNAAQRGSSTRIERFVLLEEPPSVDGHEMTEKGYVNQRATLERRASIVERLYDNVPAAGIYTT